MEEEIKSIVTNMEALNWSLKKETYVNGTWFLDFELNSDFRGEYEMRIEISEKIKDD